jgi:colanic acid/amylovoran biosynthesis glycosyltransferase
VYEPVEWLRTAGHHVEVIAERRGALADSDPSRFPVTIAPPWYSPAARLGRLLAEPAATVHAFGAANAWQSQSGWTVPELVARATLPVLRSAEFVLAHFGPLATRWLPVAGVAGRRFAAFIHGHDATAELQRRPELFARFVRSGGAALTNSEYLRGRLAAAGFPPERIGIVPLGVAEELANVPDRPALQSRRILTIARLVPKKGLADSLRAFAAAKPSLGDGWCYQIVGDGPLLPELQALATELGVAGDVQFRGYLDRKETLAALRNSAVFLLASRTAASGDTEGTPVSILEAASIGLPVVSTLHAGIPEILPQEAACEGWLVPEGDVAGLAAGLTRAAEPDVRHRWGDACRAFARVRHAPNVFVENLLTALERYATVPLLWD